MGFNLKKSDLNFRVYTASALPETGQENDIVIISNTPMKNWILSPDNPKGAPRNDGDVWIRYYVNGDTSNVLKNNTMMIFTISARQYINGVWADVVAKSYINGVWVDWTICLYKNGNTFDDITGGYAYGSKTTFEADRIKIYIDSQNQESYACTNNRVDLSNVSTLYMKGRIAVRNAYSSPTKVYLYATENKITSVTDNIGGGTTIIEEHKPTCTSTPDVYKDIILSLDVSNITGNMYIFTAVKNPSNYTYTTLYITEIYGEVNRI